MRRKFLYFFLTIIGLIVGSAGAMAAYTPTSSTETIMLTKANVDAQDYLTATDNWATGKSYGASLGVSSGDYLNMSKAERTMSITVSGVESFKVAVYDTNGSRDWTITVGSESSTQTTDKSGLQWTDAVETGTTGEVTITLAGAGSSVYPIAIMVSKPETSAPEFTTDLPASATVNLNVAKEFQVEATGNTKYQWYKNSTNSTVGAQAITGATASKYSYTATSIGTEYIYCVASNKIGNTTSAICAVSTSLSTECKLISVQFSNSAYGTIMEGMDAVGTEGEEGYVPAVPPTVTVPYIAGTDAPGVKLQSFECSKNALYATDNTKIRITAEDGNTYTDYQIVYKPVTPLAVSADIETSAFTEVPEWVYNPYGYDGTKGIKFAKAVNEDSNMRITKGNTRQYYFIAPAKALTLTSATSSRNINVYVNGTKLSAPTASGAADATIEIALDSENPNMVCIESNQTGGDGGFKAYAITANGQQTTDPEEGPGAVEERTATWDFQTMEAKAVSINGATGTVPSAIEGVALTVDATSGKLETRGSDAQFNQGAIISVPVRHAGDVVTVVSYPDYHNYTIAGTAAAADTETYTATEADATAGKVDIVATATAYLYSISVKQVAITEGGEEEGGEEGGEEIDPSTAKLLWDYTENAPAGSPDNGLTYGSNVNDPAGTNNGLKGVKLNSSGYAYFTKAAVAGTLKLTYGPRKNSDASNLGIYTYTSEPKAETKIGVTKSVTELSTDAIELTAEQNNIYIVREAAVEQVLTKIEFIPFVPRTFVDFKINFTKSWASSSTITEGTTYYVTATDADGVPTFTSEAPADGKYLCTFKGKYHGSAYGIYGTPVFTVPVDGSVKVYYGMNDYGADITAKNKAGETVLSGNSKGAKFSSNPANVMSMTYAKGEDVITLTGGGYVPYFAVEACEVAPCTVTYKDQDGKVLGTVDTFEGEALGEIPYGEADVTVPEGSAFRGWVYASGVKAKATDALNGNTTITALVTPIETVAVGTVQNYNLESAIFYPEDHETISIEGGNYYNNHGWDMAANGTISVDVAGNAQVVLKLCEYGNGTTITVTDANGSTVAADVPAKADKGADGAKYTFNYTGEATTLTLTFAAQSYIHAISVYNVNDFVEKDAETGWYIVPAGDGAALILAINSANSEEGATIFLPNGTYDLGNTVLTTISGKNMSIIGESMEGTIIKTTALEEKLGVADLFYNTSTGLYMQDLTLQNDFDYYNSGSAGRAAVLQDNGNQTIMRNVAMRSYQDTYYSKQGNYYFEGGLIQGTVDYICGGGNAFFENITLLNKSRSATGNTGDDTMTAYNGTGMYVFNNCAVESECSTFNFGRSWETAYVVYLNTTIKSGKLVDTRFSTKDMNKTAPRFFGEYNTIDESGNNMNTPASNHLKTDNGGDFESVLTAEKAAAYTLESMFTGWDPKTIATQVEEMPESTDGLVFLVDGKVTTTCPESGTVRIANSRGGFGPEIEVSPETAINDINAVNTHSANGKFLSNGRVIIRKDGKTYSTVGLEVK